jgi:hypothetical protein
MDSMASAAFSVCARSELLRSRVVVRENLGSVSFHAFEK